MNSYPIELLGQHAPLMFVAGLTDTVPQQPASPRSPTLASSPPSLPSLPPALSGQDTPNHTPNPPNIESNARQDAFSILLTRLRVALTSKAGKGVVWDPNRAKSFQVLLVDKGVRLPPRKIYPQQPQGAPGGQSQPTGIPHSPLSPLTSSSPLYPDGLIAPIWVRKHIELVPCVFVLFKRLFEPPSRSPLQEGRDGAEKEEERTKDAELAAEIAARKKTTNERNIKLTVVLLASRWMLDDPSLDTRLSFIRRQSGLDSRAALFVLSPVNQAELADFVKSLQGALYESAMEYYTAHSKRVRRKRNRHSHSSSIPPNTLVAGGAGRPLREIGWTVRYDYKLALFAEFRSEQEVSRKHYEDCWTALIDMLGSTAILPPRTKRWAEAKVLADCVNIKICKFFLYSKETSLTLAHFNRHLSKMGELSRGWGIGEETFEFWSWVARQYRIFAELLETGVRLGGLELPLATNSIGRGPSPVDPLQAYSQAGDRSLGVNPSTTLQHPGYYYYIAATCTQQRHQRYLKVLEQEASRPSTLSQSPGFANEKKVEHHSLIIELYTKAYELFKKHRIGQSRQTFYIAYRIAETYHAAGKYESAVRFFERIAKTYRRERWGEMLRPILSMWYECARNLGDVETTLKLLVEMLSPGATDDEEERAGIEGDIVAILKDTMPSSIDATHPLMIDLSGNEPIFTISVVFWRPEVYIGDPAPFQVQITAPDDISLEALPFSFLKIYVAHGDGNDTLVATIRHQTRVSSSEDKIQSTELGLLAFPLEGPSVATANGVAVQGDLRWSRGTCKVFTGSLTSEVAQEFRVTKLVLGITEGSWNIEIPIDPSPSSLGRALKSSHSSSVSSWLAPKSKDRPPTWIRLSRPTSWTTKVRPKPHLIVVQIDHPSPAYLNEQYPVKICISNVDERALDVIVDILLHPPEDDSSVNNIIFEDQESTSLIKGVSLGTIEPGSMAGKTLYLVSHGAVGDRILDISITSRVTTQSLSSANSENWLTATDGDTSVGESTTDGNLLSQDACEMLETIHISVVQPLSSNSRTTYHRSPEPLVALMDVDSYKDDVFREQMTAIVIMEVENVGPWEVEVERIRWIPLKETNNLKLKDTSLNDKDFPIALQKGDQYAIITRFGISLDGEEVEKSLPGPGNFEVDWKRKGTKISATTTLQLQPLKPPEDGIIGLIYVPPTARLHQPFVVTLQLRSRNVVQTADVILHTESSDGFVIAGPRTTKLPSLLPETSVEVHFNVVPLLCGNQPLPVFKAFDKRKPIGHTSALDGEDKEDEGTVVLQPIQLVDARSDERNEEGEDLQQYPSGPGGAISVLVLPR